MSVDVAAEVARYRKSAAALRRLTGSNASTEKEGLVNRLHGVPAGDRPELRARLRVVRAGIAATMKGTR